MSMFYGLRLVAAIVESKIVLGATVIKEPVQVGVQLLAAQGWNPQLMRSRVGRGWFGAADGLFVAGGEA